MFVCFSEVAIACLLIVAESSGFAWWSGVSNWRDFVVGRNWVYRLLHWRASYFLLLELLYRFPPLTSWRSRLGPYLSLLNLTFVAISLRLEVASII